MVVTTEPVQFDTSINKYTADDLLEPWTDLSLFSKDVQDGVSSIIKKDFKPTDCQAYTWPYLMANFDVVCIAETGSGKTLAFLCPIFENIIARNKKAIAKNGELGKQIMLTLLPTRELAEQVADVAIELAKECHKSDIKLKVCSLIGGMKRGTQAKNAVSSHIMIGTPGRVQDFVEDGTINLRSIRYFVLDEADRMLGPGFYEAVLHIQSKFKPSKKPQTIMFTATWTSDVQKLTKKVTPGGYIKVVVPPSSNVEMGIPANITQSIHIVASQEKDGQLKALLRKNIKCKIIVFALYKKEAERVAGLCRTLSADVVTLQGDMAQEHRQESIKQFRAAAAKTTPILVATDVASRGLDIRDVDLVINYTFPLTVEDYIHRCGRTGRAGAQGRTITFFNPDGNHNELGHAPELKQILLDSKQEVGEGLENILNTRRCEPKKRNLNAWGCTVDAELASKKPVHIEFSDSE